MVEPFLISANLTSKANLFLYHTYPLHAIHGPGLLLFPRDCLYYECFKMEGVGIMSI